MSIVSYTSNERDLLARLMRAEALGEGNLGMLMVGNVGVNRVLADCLTFKTISSINSMIYQKPGGFSGVDSPLFFSNPTSPVIPSGAKRNRGIPRLLAMAKRTEIPRLRSG